MESNTVIIIAVAVVVIGGIALAFGRRLGRLTHEFLGFKATVEETKRPGARVSDIESKGNRNEGIAVGEGSTVEGIRNEGDDNTFSAKTDDD